MVSQAPTYEAIMKGGPGVSVGEMIDPEIPNTIGQFLSADDIETIMHRASGKFDGFAPFGFVLAMTQFSETQYGGALVLLQPGMGTTYWWHDGSYEQTKHAGGIEPIPPHPDAVEVPIVAPTTWNQGRPTVPDLSDYATFYDASQQTAKQLLRTKLTQRS